jgi:hypothetical protein
VERTRKFAVPTATTALTYGGDDVAG